ncbi:MAG: DUF167 domain-containing protein [archaeon]
MTTNNFDFQNNEIINLQVICNSKENKLEKLSFGNYKLWTTSVPVKGKANKEIIKYFKKLGYKIEIIKGEKSNHKLIKILI